MTAPSRCLLLLVGLSLVVSCDEEREGPPRPVPTAPAAPPKPPAPWFSGSWEGDAGPARVSVVLTEAGEVSDGSLSIPGANEPLAAVGAFDQEKAELRLRFRTARQTAVGVLRRTAAGDAFSGKITWSVALSKWEAGSATARLEKVSLE